MQLKSGMKLTDGTILQYTQKGFGPRSTVGKLEISEDGTRWFIAPNNSGWRIRPNSQHDWDKYELGSEGDFTLAKLHENKSKTSLELLKEYRNIVSEIGSIGPNRITSKAWQEGYKSALGDFKLKSRSEYGYNCTGIPGSYSQEYGDGYRKGWDTVKSEAERENYGKNRGKSYYDVNESYYSDSPVYRSVMNRLERSHPEIFTKYESNDIEDAVGHIASFAGRVEEIGSSDVSIWTKQVIDDLTKYYNSGVSEGFNTKTVMFDIKPINDFLTKRGFEDKSEDPAIKTYVNNKVNLKIHLYTDNVYWTIEDTNQPDDILEDGSGVNKLAKIVSNMLKMVSKPKVKSGKFNTCSNCDGKGCQSCEYTGEYAVGMNKDHYN